MSGDNKPSLMKHKLLLGALILALLIVLTLVVLIFMPGKYPGSSLLSDIVFPKKRSITVREFVFDVGRDRVFAHADMAVAAVGTLGLQVQDPDGNETLRDSFRITRPALAESGGYFIAFDIGGSSVRVFNETEILASIDTEGSIVSASINKNGWFCIVTQEPGAFRSTITVYNKTGSRVFMVNMGTGFALCAEISPDNKSLTILNFTEAGSKLTAYDGLDTDKDEPDYEHYLGDEVFLYIKYLSNTKILAVSAHSVQVAELSASMTTSPLYEFPEKRLGGFTHTNDFIALLLYDYGIGYSGRIVSFDIGGGILGELESNLEIFDMAAASNSLVLLRSDGVAFLSKTLEEYPMSENNILAATAANVLAITEDIALAANDHSAVVVKREED
ncbi:MAG: DUF5711 family protein [Oscillospiraceae bacterium]|nr:DUF5711 family protein [Oscillospiraceae bacterium]